LSGVAAESLFGRWNASARAYDSVPDEDRQWLLGQFAKVAEYGLPAIAIDYADPRDRDAMRENARRIASLGIVPWVGDGALSMVGIGAWADAAPGLVVHDTSFDGEAHSSRQQSIVMPVSTGLPGRPARHPVNVCPRESSPDRCEVVTWLGPRLPANASWTEFATACSISGCHSPVQHAGILDQRPPGHRSIHGLDTRLVAPMAIAQRDPMMGFEWARGRCARASWRCRRRPDRARCCGFAMPAARRSMARRSRPGAVSRFALSRSRRSVATTSAAGSSIRSISSARHFACRMPVPDPTTETGRRLLIHIDGDGFPSRAEIPGAPVASEAMRREFIERYPVPHTVSVIEGEISEQGLFPELAPQLEAIARRIFALPHVEIASHSRSHPLRWHAITRAADAPAANPATADTVREYSLKLPGYQFNLASEITGSAAYIDRRLAPPGKKTAVFLWTGDCVPPAQALRTAWEGGLLNMNGGDTVATRRNPTLSLVAPMSIRKEGWLQIYAPNQNENVYTNLWTGPFFGFEQVIETFEITEEPLRLKPINIYYHTYAASKGASIVALRRVYDWALARPVHPVFASEYIRKVLDFEDMAIGREVAGARRWRIAGSGQCAACACPPARRAHRSPRPASRSWAGSQDRAAITFTWAAPGLAGGVGQRAGGPPVAPRWCRPTARPDACAGDSLRMRFTRRSPASCFWPTMNVVR
jgi:hypothetical protein